MEIKGEGFSRWIDIDGKWHHVAVKYDDSKKSYKMYVDGKDE